MRKLGIMLLLLGGAEAAAAQSFLRDYQRFLRQHRPATHLAKTMQQQELRLLGKLFAAQLRRTGRRFDTADTLHILTVTPSEIGGGYVPSAGLIWTRTDTLSFAVEYAGTGRHTISYSPFLQPQTDSYADVGPDSLVRLVSRQQFDRARQLATEHRGFDGVRSQVVSAIRTPAGYQITELFLPPFGLFRPVRNRPGR